VEHAIEMLNITKKFGTLVANDNVTLKVKKGEIHAILGENGAGKSTLMSILFGLIKADSGSIKIFGKKVNIDNPNVANDLKIGMVHQHFKLVEVFTVLQNVVLGKETVKNTMIDYTAPRKKLIELSKKYKLNVDVDAKISDITVGMQQRVEILKMLYRDADILIFDEPTAVLTPQEIEELMHIIRNFAKEGKSIVVITHKLDEIKMLADRVSVLRRGKYMGTFDVKKTSVAQMAETMVGRKVLFSVKKSIAKPKEIILSVKDIVVKKNDTKKYVDKVSFDVRAGEIVTLAGIEGNGQSQLIKAITGLIEPTSGKVVINKVDVTNKSIRNKIELGMSHIPEDRQKDGLILDYTLKNNFIICEYYLDKFQKNGFLNFEKIDNYADQLINKYDVRSSAGKNSIARGMSGGNQQKAIIARELSRNGKLVIAVQPTRGLDVGAIEYVHKKLIEARDQGAAVLIVSLELDEVMDISDRILVMFEGKIVKETSPKKITMKEIGLYMAGSNKGARKNV
jgi:general nucleoside transport system ATP-binding protein